MRRVNKVLFLPFYQCFADAMSMRYDNVDQAEYGVAVSFRNKFQPSSQIFPGIANFPRDAATIDRDHSQRVQDARTYRAGCANVVNFY